MAANMQQKFLTKHVLAVKGLTRISKLLAKNEIPEIPEAESEAVLDWLNYLLAS